MAKQTRLTNLVVNAQADALAALCNGGFIDIYDGTQPATADTAIGSQVLGVSLTFGSPAFASASGGVLTANPITGGVAVANINPATWARIYKSDHTTAVMDVSVGTSNANMLLPTTNIAAGVSVSCSSFSHTVAKTTSGS